MRRYVSWLLFAAAVVVLLVGAALAILFGPDNRASTGPHPLDTAASVVVSAPEAIGVSGPTVVVTAAVPQNVPLFVGVGNAVDVASYADGVEQTRVDDVSLPWEVTTSEVTGEVGFPAPPPSLDWWLATGQGRGEAAASVQLPDEPASYVVAALDGRSLDGLEVSASYEVTGAFGIGLGLVGLAVGLALFGWIARQAARAGGVGRPTAGPVSKERRESPRATSGAGRAGRVVATVALASTAGCAIPSGVAGEPTKLAASGSQATEIVERWAVRRAEALRQLDAAPLVSVEAAETLAVDRGAFQVARRLLVEGPQQIRQDLRLEAALSPRLTAYPLWFLAVVEDGERDVSKLQVHRRADAAGPWQLVAQAEVLPQTQLPELAMDETGAILPLAGDDTTGLAVSPQEVAQAYVGLLADPSTGGDEAVLVDSFVQQMRSITETQSSIDRVRFRQGWSARDVQWAARTGDGGALVFATMVRTDRYRLRPGTAIDWPEGSEQEAFLSGRAYSEATLRYLHQVLLYLPPAGGGQARAVGQYGGVVSGTGV